MIARQDNDNLYLIYSFDDLHKKKARWDGSGDPETASHFNSCRSETAGSPSSWMKAGAAYARRRSVENMIGAPSRPNDPSRVLARSSNRCCNSPEPS